MNNPLTYLLLGVLVAWVFSYFYSLQYNRRKLQYMLRWMSEALPLLGSKPQSAFRGQEAVSVTFGAGRGKISEAAVVVAVQKRELFAMLLSMVRGGRDSMTIMAATHQPPRPELEFEVFEAKSPVPRSVALRQDWEIVEYPANPAYKVAYRVSEGREKAFQVLALLLDDGYNVRQIKVRTVTPHLFVCLNLQQQPRGAAADLFQLIRNLADEVGQVSLSVPPDSRSGSGRPRQLNRAVKPKRAAVPRQEPQKVPDLGIPGYPMPKPTRPLKGPDLN